MASPVRRRRAGFVGGVLLSLVGGAAADGSESPGREAVVEAVQGLSSPEEKVRDRARRALERQGPGTVPVLFDLLAHRAGQGDSPRVDRRVEVLVTDVLRAWPEDTVVAGLVDALGEEPNVSERLVLVRLLGEVASGSSLAALTEAAANLGQAGLRHRSIAVQVEDALVAVLERDPSTVDKLSSRLTELAPDLRPILARALGRFGSDRGLPVLERFLGQRPETDLVVLGAIAELNAFGKATREGTCADLVRPYLGSLDPKTRRQAAVTVARIGDEGSIFDLVMMLGDRDRRVQNGALWALKELTGLRWSADTKRWERWLADEETWYRERAGELVSLATGDDVATACASVRELAGHVVFRRELIPELANLIHDESTEVSLSACDALVRLGGAAAAPLLVDALDDGREEVRAAAQAGLRGLTAQELPADRDVWLDWIGA